MAQLLPRLPERIQAEEALRQSEAKLMAAQQLTQVGSWELAVTADTDLETARADWSPELFSSLRIRSSTSGP